MFSGVLKEDGAGWLQRVIGVGFVVLALALQLIATALVLARALGGPEAPAATRSWRAR